MSEYQRTVYDNICVDLIGRGWELGEGPVNFWTSPLIPKAEMRLKQEHHLIRIEGVYRFRSDARTQYWDEVTTLEDGIDVLHVIIDLLKMEERKDAGIR